MKCDIIMPVWDQLEFTKECITSINNNTKYPIRLIIIDNASKRNTKEYLSSLAGEVNFEIKLIRNEENLGFVKAVNQGLKESSAPYICILNNDTIVTEEWLTEMVSVLESDATIGLLNPSSNNLGQRPGSMDITQYAQSLKNLKGEIIEMGACLGFCLLFKREIFEKLGLLDEVYGLGLFDDTDYSRKVESLGLVCARAKAAYVHHRISKSFLKRRNFEDIFKKNQQIFNKRWGKPKRLLYVVSKDHRKLYDWIKTESLKKARYGNWIWVFLKDKSPFQVKEHSNIRLFYLPTILFEKNCIFRILKRRKKFDSIYVDEDSFREQLNQLKKYHNADVMLMGG